MVGHAGTRAGSRADPDGLRPQAGALVMSSVTALSPAATTAMITSPGRTDTLAIIDLPLAVNCVPAPGSRTARRNWRSWAPAASSH